MVGLLLVAMITFGLVVVTVMISMIGVLTVIAVIAVRLMVFAGLIP